MWSPSDSANTNNSSSKDRRPHQRSRHQEQRNFTTSNLVDSSRQKHFRHDREDIYSSTSASTSAAVLSPPRRSLSYEDRLSAMASASISASNTPIPSPSTLRTQRPLGSKRSNLTSSTPASPSVPSPRFAQSNSDNALGPTPPLRSPMFSETSSSRRPSANNNSATAVAGSSRRSSAARSPDSAAAALAASKYDMKRMLSKPAPPMSSSSFGSSSAGSAGILSAASRTEDDVFNGYHNQSPLLQHQQPQDIDPLAYSSSVDTSRSYLKNANPDFWPSDTPALGAGSAGGKTFLDLVAPAPASTSNSTATRTRSRNESSTSSSAAAQSSQPSQQQMLYHTSSSSSSRNPHRARALTQTSSMTATTTTSSSVFPPSSNLSHSNTSYFADYSVDSHTNSAAVSSSSRSRIPPMPGVAFPISDDVGGSFLSGSGSGPGAGTAKSGASPGPTRALTPASAIAYAYQQQQQLRSGSTISGAREFDSTRPSPSPSPNPSFYTASSSSTSESGRAYRGDSEYYQHQQYLTTPFGSARTLGGGGGAGSPISPTSGRVATNGDQGSGTLGNVEKSRSSGALRTLGRKVSGKFSRKTSGGLTTSGRRGTIAAGAEDAINGAGAVGSSVGTNEGSFLAMSSEFGGYEGDDSTGGVGSARGAAFSASSSSRGGSGRSRSQYDVSQRRSPSGYFGDASGGPAGLADVSSSSIDASLPTSPVSPASQQQHQSTTMPSSSHHRPSKLSKTKSLLRLSQQNRSVTDPTPVPEPPTPSSTGVGTSIWKMVKKFSSSTLREKHRSGASPVEPVPPVPALPPGVVSSGSVSRRSSVSDDYGVVVGGSGAFGGFGRDEGGGRFSISSAVSRPKSEAKRSMIGRSRSGTVVSSAQSHGHGFSVQNRGGPPPPDLPRSGPRSPRHEHNRSLSQSRTTATLSSSPISSDLSSSKYFFGRQQSSPRTSTSSYLAYSDTQDYGPPPPLPVSQKQQQAASTAQHILPPDEIAAMLREYGEDLGGGVGSAKEDDDGSSSNYHNMYSSATSRKSFASSAAPQKGSGLSAPPSRRSTDRSRSRDPPSSRKSSASGKGEPASGQGDLQGRNLAASTSSSSLSMPPAKPTKSKKPGNFQHPPLNMLRKSSGNPAASRYVAVQGGGETSPSSAGPKTSPAKKTVLHRLMRSKSEVNLTPTPSTAKPPTPPTARPPPPPTTTSAESKERRRTSPPIPSPSSPTKRWSIDERRGSAGSGNLLNPPSAPLSPTRAASFDLQRSRPSSFSTTVMFRDLTEAAGVKRSEDEKNKMWDMLLEKSEKAGGTLHAKIDSSFY